MSDERTDFTLYYQFHNSIRRGALVRCFGSVLALAIFLPRYRFLCRFISRFHFTKFIMARSDLKPSNRLELSPAQTQLALEREADTQASKGDMRVLSVNVAMASEMFFQQSNYVHRIMSGIYKHPVQDAVLVKKLNLVGDEQVDLTAHGGLDKAVYAYPSEHYAFWAAKRLAALKHEEPLPPGSMGENLTLLGLLETDVWIGDRLHIGSTILQVTEPRQPCFKFNEKMGFPHAVKLMVQSGRSGFYLRVIQEGEITAGDAVILEAGPRNMSVAQINAQRWRGRQRELM